MSSYNSPQHKRRTKRRPSNKAKRSVGATAISAPGANALGLSRRSATRPHGRGETARRVEASRAQSISARPAVYTGEAKKTGLLSRIRLPELHAPSFDVPTIPLWAIVLVVLAIVLAVVAGSARTYYVAWRDAGVLHAEYEALSVQNGELNHEIERLQTLEGIEDEARSRGYVYPDEEALVVEGVEEAEVADPALVDAAVEEYEKSLPWYVGILDTVFGYQHE